MRLSLLLDAEGLFYMTLWYEMARFPGYRINQQGEVLSMKQGEPRVMKSWVSEGRRRVMLRQDGKYVNCKIAVLLLTTFVGPRPEDLEACHNDGNSLNDALSNLRWDTSTANNLDQVRHGTHYEANRTKCDQGHDYTPENTMWRYGKGGKAGGKKYRKCKECHRLAIAAQRAKKKAQAPAH
jgi:hypothetical protein